MSINNIKDMLNVTLISKNDKQFEKILQYLNNKERILLKNELNEVDVNNNNDNNHDNNGDVTRIIEYFSTNIKEMKWRKGERLLNMFLNSL